MFETIARIASEGRLEHSLWVARYLKRIRDLLLETDAWALEDLERWMKDCALLACLDEEFENPVEAADSVIHMKLVASRMVGEWSLLKIA